MDSIGILYSKRINTQEPDSNVCVELHMNYLKTIKYFNLGSKPIFRRGYNRYLDIGVMIKPPVKDIEAIYLYLPFVVEESNISDLGESIKDPSMFCTLFNGDYTIQNISEHPLYHEVKPVSGDKELFWLYSLGKNTYSLEKLVKGSLIKIELKELPPTGNFVQGENTKGPGVYFRLRISNLKKNDFYYEERVSNDVFQSAFSKAEMVDIRINEIREFDKEVVDDLRKNRHFVNFDKFHFFFIGSSENEQVAGNVGFHDCRLLDSSKWKNYEDAINDKRKKYLAYHWSIKNNGTAFTTCNVFLRTIYSSLNFKKSFKYCLIVIILGFIGSYLCNMVQSINSKTEANDTLGHSNDSIIIKK